MRPATDAKVPDSSRQGRSRLKQVVWRLANGLSLGGLYGWPLELGWLRGPSLNLPLRGLGEGFFGARLVQISDLHCGPLVKEQFLRQCADAVNAMRPDFVAVTGDLVTVPHRRYARAAADLLARLTPTIATLVVLGNHDYGIWHPRMAGRRGAARDLTARLEDAGAIVLNNESRDFFRAGAAVQFVGAEDLWSGRHDPERAFRYVRAGVPIVGLVHNPDAAPDFAGRGAQWVLAGHTHSMANRSSRFHEAAFPARHKHFVSGRYPLPAGATLYVNGGLGPARRFRARQRPEITRFVLVPAAPEQAAPVALRSPVGVQA